MQLFHLQKHQKFGNKFNQGGKRSLHRKVQVIDERN